MFKLHGMLEVAMNQSKRYFFDFLQSGGEARCPCCERFAKTYKRKLYSTMAYQLIKLRKLSKEDSWVHISQISTRVGPGDFTKLRYWGLVISKPNEDDPTKKESGYWKITEKGRLFVEDKLSIKKYAVILFDDVINYSGSEITIKECLGSKFNYEELMAA